MTHARCYALAFLVSVCCLGSKSAFAQTGPAPGPGYAPAYPTPPFETPEPMSTAPWYGTGDDVEPSINAFGPQVRVNSWFLRAEYLHYNIDSPGNVLLGAPVLGINDPTKPFVIFAPGTQSVLGIGTVPTTDSLRLTDTSGVQVTGGLELIDGGRFEVSAFMLARKQTGYKLTAGQTIAFDTDFDIPGDPLPIEILEGESTIGVIGTSTLSNGQISDHIFLYNQSFAVTFTSQLWGGEANYLMDHEAVDTVQFLPLIGVRYLNLTEHFTQIGVFQDQFIGGPSITTTIGSTTMNNLWGGQIGLRAQVVWKYLEIGATPKVMFLGDTAMSSVYAARFRSNDDPTVSHNDTTTKFTFGGDLNGFVNINVSPNFTVRGGYSILWINQVTRPHRDIVYDDHGPLAPAGIGQQFVFHDIFIHGFNFGCEFRF